MVRVVHRLSSLVGAVSLMFLVTCECVEKKNSRPFYESVGPLAVLRSGGLDTDDLAH